MSRGRVVTVLLHCGNEDGTNAIPIRDFTRVGRFKPRPIRRPPIEGTHYFEPSEVRNKGRGRLKGEAKSYDNLLSLNSDATAWLGIELAGQAPQLFTHVGHVMTFPVRSMHRSITKLAEDDPEGLRILRLAVLFPEP